MALSLAESAKLSLDMLQRGVVETVISVSPELEYLSFINVEGNSFSGTKRTRWARRRSSPWTGHGDGLAPGDRH
jgi:hypothetical protein